jgi:lysophospholipase L1-like esterase
MLRDTDRGRFRCIVAVATLALLLCGSAEARKPVSGPPPAVPALDPALAGVPLDPNWRKHVFVVTDSVVLGAKQQFINALPDWEVTFTGRPALMVDKGLNDYVRGQRNTGPVAVVALGYNTLWEKDRRNFKRWSDRFDKHVEDMLAALKERGAKKIVWVMLRELTPDMIATGSVSLSQYNRYAWYFPYVNERLKAIKERHPEMSLADWAIAGKVSGVTYDAIHLNGRGADRMVEVVKTAMGLYGEPNVASQKVVARVPAQQVSAPAPSAAAVAEPPRAEPVRRVVTSVQSRAETLPPRIEPAQVGVEPAPSAAAVAEPPRAEPVRRVVTSVQSRAETLPPRIEPAQVGVEPARVETAAPRAVETPPAEDAQVRRKSRGHIQDMFAMTQFRTAPVVMLGDSLTQRAQWNEITGCGFVVNRGIGGDVSAGVLRRLDDVTKFKPSAVFLMIGINDIARRVPNETIIGNVRRTIERLNDAGAKVYLTLVLPVTRGYVPKMNPTVAELNAAYIALAKETKATVVDFRQEMRTEEGALRNDLTVDGIHLNPEGYRAWRDAVTPLVARHCAPAGELVAQARPPKVVAPPAPQPVAEPAPRVAVADATASIPVRAPMRGAWVIQVGAFPAEEKAQERIRQAQDLGRDLVANANPFTEKVVKGSQELYRARFAGFNQSAAEAACSYFKRNDIDCISMKR